MVDVFKALSQDRVQQLVVVMIFLFLLVGDARTWNEEDDLDEMDVTQSRFPAGFRPIRMCGCGCVYSLNRRVNCTHNRGSRDENVEVPQIQFIVRVPDFSVALERGVPTVHCA